MAKRGTTQTTPQNSPWTLAKRSAVQRRPHNNLGTIVSDDKDIGEIQLESPLTGTLNEIGNFFTNISETVQNMGHVTFKFWEITDNILERVQDADIVTM